MKVWNVAIYARVSTDKQDQSESISSQIGNMKKWIVEKSRQDKENIYNIVDIYEDEGTSGSTFERDAFIRMKKDIEKSRINMVITRDLSRFSRNYILAGYYLEDYFKVNNVRFISILDNVDTDKDFDDIIPFKNILNEMYIKDCSKRVRAALTERMQRGSSIASKPPYGYKFETKMVGAQKYIYLVPRGDETTEVVKKIFELYINGLGIGKIATYLNKKGVASPSNRNSRWTNNTIVYILKNPKYAGYMIQQRYRKVSYKCKRVIAVPKSEWIIGDEFQGIIEKDTFNYVQELIDKKRKNYRYKGEVKHLFSGVLRCAECGSRMQYRSSYSGYKCAKSQSGEKKCTAHSIKEEYLLNELKECIKDSIDNGSNLDIYYKNINNINFCGSLKKKLSSIDAELSTINRRIEQLYEDKSKNILLDINFENMLLSIQQRQEKLIEKRVVINNSILEEKSRDVDIKMRVTREIDDLIKLKNIDRNFIESFVDKIIVSENNLTKQKCIEIFLKFKK